MKHIFTFILFSILSLSISISQESLFGKNKVQYHSFNWYYIQSSHFDIYFTDGGEELATFTADEAEKAYRSIARSFRYNINNRIPFIVYNSHNDFQQTNVVSSYLEEGVGGVTELFKNRVVLPFEGEYRKFRHVIHHELVHAVINDMFYGGSLQSILSNNITLQLPLWFNEGLAEYEALQWDVNSDMFLRDAAVHEYLPEIDRLHGYFAYRGGQAVWWYIAQRYGKEKIADILHHVRGSKNVDAGFRSALGLSIDELSERWQKEMKKIYWPDVSLRQEPDEFSRRLTDHKKDGNFYNTSPALSPQGDKIAFITDRNDYFDIYIMSAIDGELKEKLISGQRTPDFEELHLLTPGMSWSPDGERLAITVKSGEEDAIILINVKDGDEEKLLFDLDGIFSVDWSPNGKELAFVGNKGKQSDIYVYNLETKELLNLTNDIFSDSDPSWLKDGSAIIFSSDRSSHLVGNSLPPNFKMNQYRYHQLDLYSVEVKSGVITRLTATDDNDEMSPVSSPDGKSILFISDANGINNIYRMQLDSLIPQPLTNSLGGIYQLSVSNDGGKIAFVSLNSAGFDIFLMRTPFEEPVKGNLEITEFVKRKKNESEEVENTTIALSADSLRSGDSLNAYNGEVPIDIHKYVFQPNFEKIETNRDSLFTPVDNKDSSDNYIVNDYKLSFSPDIIYGAAGYSTFYGVQGSAIMAFSDLMGDHQIFVQTNLVIDGLKNGDYALAYFYLPERIDWGFQAFHSARFLDLNGDFLIDSRFRTYGFALTASYPFTKFKRLDVSATYFRVSRENLLYYVPTQRRDVLLPSMSFVHDNVLWGYTGPNNGTRYNFTLMGTPQIGNNGMSFYSALLDYRSYFRLTRGYSFAFRFAGGGSFGKNPQYFIVGGTENWINRKFENNQFPIQSPEDFLFLTSGVPLRGYSYNAQFGTRYALLNAELRYPFLGYIVAGPLPIFFQSLTGAIFLDIGSAWVNEKGYRGTMKNAAGETQTKDLLIGTGTGVRVFLLGMLLKIDVAWQYHFNYFSPPQYLFSLGADF
ncbi:MAG: PD40 domain-containing protein [Ignavibacteriales bacterium]|nr:PD40 domain-containing protein [Ignavibacteriales bacterium]